MQGAGTEHSTWLRKRDEVATGHGPQWMHARLAGLESIAVSMGCVWIFCSMDPPRGARLATAFLYVLLSCGVGALNFWALGPRRRWGFRRMMVRLAMSWVVVPPAVLLLRADSWFGVFAGVLIGATFALALEDGRELEVSGPWRLERGLRFALFESEASSALPPWTALLLSVLIFTTLFALGREWIAAAMLLGAVCAAMAGFRWSIFQAGTAVCADRGREARRLAALGLVSILVTSTLLMPEQVKQAQAEDWRAMQAMMHALRGPVSVAKKPKGHHLGAADLAGVPKVFLWPEPPKKAQVLMAPPMADKARAIHRSLVIPFSGPYIYTEVAGLGLKTKPLVAKGSPLKVKVKSGDGSPISMVARQRLATPIDVASCGAIEVMVRQGEPATATGLGLVLSHTGERHGAQLRLATKPLAADGLGVMVVGKQTVRFAVPEGVKLRSFDQIEVLVRRPGEVQRGARLKVVSFTLVPR